MRHTYRATRDILSFGQPRIGVTRGDLLLVGGGTVRIREKEYVVPTIDDVIKLGWLVLVEEETSLVLAPPTLPAVLAPLDTAAPTKAEPPKRISFASPEAKELSGRRPPADQPHVWGSGNKDAPEWLNSADGSRQCRVCGVTERPGLIRADRTRGDGSQQFHYVDAYNNAITSLEPLSCPVYLGDPGSAAAVAKEHVRRVRGRVDVVEGAIDEVQARLDQLEADNAFFRNQLLERPILDAAMVAEALLLIASRSGATPQLADRIRGLLPEAAEDVLVPVLELVPITKSEDD